MGKDDWKYDEESWEDGEEEKKAPPAERQCLNCLHWVSREADYCPWCGKAFGDKDRRR